MACSEHNYTGSENCDICGGDDDESIGILGYILVAVAVLLYTFWIPIALLVIWYLPWYLTTIGFSIAGMVLLMRLSKPGDFD